MVFYKRLRLSKSLLVQSKFEGFYKRVFLGIAWILTAFRDVLSDRLLMYDSLECSFMRIKKPPRQRHCPVSGTNPVITSMEESLAFSETARGPNSCSVFSREPISDTLCISCEEYDSIRRKGEDHILLDVRVQEQFDLCSLPGALNVPLDSLATKIKELSTICDGHKTIYCICRRGVASIAATNMLATVAQEYPNICSVKNIVGGYNAWRSKVDRTFPNY